MTTPFPDGSKRYICPDECVVLIDPEKQQSVQTGTSRAALPIDAKQRKDVPIFSGVIKYFPRALAAVAELSRIGNDQHNPGKPLHWDRSKSGDELDALSRHLVEAGTIDTDGVRHSTKVCWRALANLEKELEAAASECTCYPDPADYAKRSCHECPR